MLDGIYLISRLVIPVACLVGASDCPIWVRRANFLNKSIIWSGWTFIACAGNFHFLWPPQSFHPLCDRSSNVFVCTLSSCVVVVISITLNSSHRLFSEFSYRRNHTLVDIIHHNNSTICRPRLYWIYITHISLVWIYKAYT